jgi:hypothetical protein
MTKREGLREQYRKAQEIMPENEKCDFGNNTEVYYYINNDKFEIIHRDHEDHVHGQIFLSGDEAEKLYHFLGGLYG